MSKKPKPKRKGEKLIWRRDLITQCSGDFNIDPSKPVSEQTVKRIEEIYIADTYTDCPDSGLYWRREYKSECL